jgi:Protein of unknown function (DUF3500)
LPVVDFLVPLHENVGENRHGEIHAHRLRFWNVPPKFNPVAACTSHPLEISPMRIFVPILVLVLTVVALAPTIQTQLRQAAQDASQSVQLVESATEFLGKLNDKQRAQATVPYDSEQRVKWHFIPLDTRKGLPLREMDPSQKEAAMKLLAASISQAGFDKAKTIMSLENLLRKIEGPNGRNERNPEKYYFTIFGDVGMNSHWGLSIEGHHLSLNFVMQGNKIVDSTPQFFASNPAEVKEDHGTGHAKGLRVLKDEEVLAFELLASLDADGRKTATLPGDVPKEIRGAGEPQPSIEPAAGLPASKMNAAQKEKLKALMTTYTSKMRPVVSKQRWELIDSAGFDKIAFAWSGADKPGIGHYYRVQGPTFLIEFINVQADAAGNPANHIHCVWRDMQGDFDLPVK